MPHFQIVTVDGDALGAVELDQHDWPNGSVIERGREPSLRVVARIEAEDAEKFTVLFVEPVDDRTLRRGETTSAYVRGSRLGRVVQTIRRWSRNAHRN